MRQICKFENVKIEDNVITNLAKSTNLDARSSINSLQMLASKYQGQRITYEDYYLSSMKGGQSLSAKDDFNTLFYVLETIFFEKSEHIWGALLSQEIQKLTRSHGDYQLLNDALFENYSNCCNYFDDNMEKSSFFLDLLSRCDLQQRFVYKH